IPTADGRSLDGNRRREAFSAKRNTGAKLRRCRSSERCWSHTRVRAEQRCAGFDLVLWRDALLTRLHYEQSAVLPGRHHGLLCKLFWEKSANKECSDEALFCPWRLFAVSSHRAA